MSRKFAIGDRVTVRQATSMFHTRTQAFTRGRTGTVVEFRPDWVIPEDEAWGRDDPERGGRVEPFYVVRFRQQDLWPNYTGFDNDTLETEVCERWLMAAADASAKESQ
jgi:thiocyanate hydrolase subunit alpha